jgi:phage-related protein
MDNAKVLVKFEGDTKNLDGATDKASKGLSKFKGIAKGVGVGLAAGVGTAVVAATGALIDLSKQSLQSRADLEQNLGGTKLLFGDAADFIEKKSKEAYKAAGMSANEYLHQVNGFAVGLKTAMGGNEKAAAKLADKIITAEADIVAATGNSQEAVQNAFNGIMKGNYTMLDNLQLGITPTKAGMQEVIDKVNEWNKTQGHATKYQMGNYADMQAALVDYVEMQGLAGYAANEAGDTITGSISAAKAAFQNFLTGVTPAKDVVASVLNAAKNIGKELLKLLPDLVSGLVELINGLMPHIPTVMKQLLPVVLQGIIELTKSLVSMLPEIINMLLQGLIMITNALAQELPTLLPQIVDAILGIIPILIDNTPEFLKAGLMLMKGLIMGLINSIPVILKSLWNIVKSILNYFKELLGIHSPSTVFAGFGKNIILGLINGIKSLISIVINAVKGLGRKIINGAKAILNPKALLSAGKNLVVGLWNGIKNAKAWVISKIKGFGASIIKGIKGIFGIKSPSKVMFEIGGYLDKGFINGVENMKTDIEKAINGTFSLSPSLTNSASTHFSPNVNVVNNINMKQDPLGQMVNNIKTFSGGAKNDYNYGKA